MLTFDNAKTIKGEALGYRTGIQYFASHKASGHNVCPKATEGCSNPCLYVQGRGRMDRTQQARIKKTLFYFNEPEAYEKALVKSINSLIRYCNKHGMKPAVRLNGTSDIPKLSITYARMFPEVQFYDYTKLIETLRRDDLPANLHLTFSRSELNETECFEALERGYNVAVVFETLPETWHGRRVINGDEHDLRFLDPEGVIVGLTPKGTMKEDQTGMVVRAQALSLPLSINEYGKQTNNYTRTGNDHFQTLEPSPLALA